MHAVSTSSYDTVANSVPIPEFKDMMRYRNYMGNRVTIWVNGTPDPSASVDICHGDYGVENPECDTLNGGSLLILENVYCARFISAEGKLVVLAVTRTMASSLDTYNVVLDIVTSGNVPVMRTSPKVNDDGGRTWYEISSMVIRIRDVSDRSVYEANYGSELVRLLIVHGDPNALTDVSRDLDRVAKENGRIENPEIVTLISKMWNSPAQTDLDRLWILVTGDCICSGHEPCEPCDCGTCEADLTQCIIDRDQCYLGNCPTRER
jgi:hypothetical protein